MGIRVTTTKTEKDKSIIDPAEYEARLKQLLKSFDAQIHEEKELRVQEDKHEKLRAQLKQKAQEAEVQGDPYLAWQLQERANMARYSPPQIPKIAADLSSAD